MNYRIGTRGSPLALWQARRIVELLQSADSSSRWEICEIKTSGDVRSEFGDELPEGIGEFSSALEKELLSGGIDLAVHSAKDVPTFLPDGLILAAFPERADARDAVIRRKGTPAVPPVGSRLGREVLGALFFGPRSGHRPRSMEFEVMWTDEWEDCKMKRIGGE